MVLTRDRSYAVDHEASVNARMYQPKGYHALLRWFVKTWRDELPGTIHAGGVEPDSRLGAPKFAPAFRAYIQGNDGRTEHPWSDSRPESTETYATPMRWTLRWLERNRHPLIASTLRFMGMQGSTTFSVTCQTCSGSVTLPDEYAEAIARDALNLAWEHYREAPTTY